MTKYREIIRLTGLGFSQRDIMASCGVAQKTVVKVQKRAKELSISWPLDESLTDIELEKLMFQKEDKPSSKRRMPDYDYIHKELLRNGVSKKLLWTEYMEDCRANGEEPCIPSSAIASNRKSRNIVQPCTLIVNLESRLKWIGQVILQQSLTRIPGKSSKHISLWVS